MICLKNWRRMAACFLCVAGLSGCSVVGFWPSGFGNEEADLVVANDSAAVVYSISVNCENQAMGVQDAGGRALLERGDTLGFALEEGETGRVTVTLSGQWGQTLGQASASYRGRPIWLTLEADGTVSVREEKLDGVDAG